VIYNQPTNIPRLPIANSGGDFFNTGAQYAQAANSLAAARENAAANRYASDMAYRTAEGNALFSLLNNILGTQNQFNIADLQAQNALDQLGLQGQNDLALQDMRNFGQFGSIGLQNQGAQSLERIRGENALGQIGLQNRGNLDVAALTEGGATERARIGADSALDQSRINAAAQTFAPQLQQDRFEAVYNDFASPLLSSLMGGSRFAEALGTQPRQVNPQQFQSREFQFPETGGPMPLPNNNVQSTEGSPQTGGPLPTPQRPSGMAQTGPGSESPRMSRPNGRPAGNFGMGGGGGNFGMGGARSGGSGNATPQFGSSAPANSTGLGTNPTSQNTPSVPQMVPQQMAGESRSQSSEFGSQAVAPVFTNDQVNSMVNRALGMNAINEDSANRHSARTLGRSGFSPNSAAQTASQSRNALGRSIADVDALTNIPIAAAGQNAQQRIAGLNTLESRRSNRVREGIQQQQTDDNFVLPLLNMLLGMA